MHRLSIQQFFPEIPCAAIPLPAVLAPHPPAARRYGVPAPGPHHQARACEEYRDTLIRNHLAEVACRTTVPVLKNSGALRHRSSNLSLNVFLFCDYCSGYLFFSIMLQGMFVTDLLLEAGGIEDDARIYYNYLSG